MMLIETIHIENAFNMNIVLENLMEMQKKMLFILLYQCVLIERRKNKPFEKPRRCSRNEKQKKVY